MSKDPEVGEVYESKSVTWDSKPTGMPPYRFQVVDERQGIGAEARWPVRMLDNGALNFYTIETFRSSTLIASAMDYRKVVNDAKAASMADQIKYALDNAERLIEQAGIQCVRRLVDGRWVLEWDDRPYNVVGSTLHEAFEELKRKSCE